MKKTFNQFKKGLEELYWPKAGDEAKFMAMHGQYKAADVGGPETHDDAVFKGTIVKKDESHASTDSERLPDAESEIKDTVKNMHSKSTDELLKTVSHLNLSTDPKHREIRDILNRELMARYKATLPHTMREEKEDDDEPAASGNEHPIMQLKAGVDRGGVKFKTKNGKSVPLSKGHSLRLLALHNAIDTAEGKSRFASAVHSDPLSVHKKYFGESVDLEEAGSDPSLSAFYNLGKTAAQVAHAFTKKKQKTTKSTHKPVTRANPAAGKPTPVPAKPKSEPDAPSTPSSSGRANLRGTLSRPKPGSAAARSLGEADDKDNEIKGGDTGWRPISKATQKILDRKKPARELARNAMRQASKTDEANDGNLANNAKPYDKVTRGDVIAGRLGKDEMGGKRKFKEDLDEAEMSRKEIFDTHFQKFKDRLDKEFGPEQRKKDKEELEAKRKAEMARGRPKNEEVEYVDEAGPFSYGTRPPKKGTVAYNAMIMRKKQEKNEPAIEPKDQKVGIAKVTKEEVDEGVYTPPGYDPSPIKGVPMKPGSMEPINKKKPLPREFGLKPNVKEAVKEPYAVGMAAAMKSTGDTPPLEKSTIKKAHKIARGIMKNEEIELEDEMIFEQIELDDGHVVEIDIELAEMIADLFDGLTEENQEALAGMIHSNLESFMDVVEFIENQIDGEE